MLLLIWPTPWCWSCCCRCCCCCTLSFHAPNTPSRRLTQGSAEYPVNKSQDGQGTGRPSVLLCPLSQRQAGWCRELLTLSPRGSLTHAPSSSRASVLLLLLFLPLSSKTQQLHVRTEIGRQIRWMVCLSACLSKGWRDGPWQPQGLTWAQGRTAAGGRSTEGGLRTP